ncbi:hypothetical protein HYW94_00800 [Candidatus Uhrbacteria bacterium]|nr:hypothetical protein [Candidatus Uhrbacteria bacterium]
MPPKKRTLVVKKRSSKKSKKTEISAPEILSAVILSDAPMEPNEQVIAPSLPASVPQPVTTVQYHVHLKQAVFLSIGFMVLFTSLLFVSTKMKAQENAASVSAVVAPTPENTRPPKQPSWWETIDPYTKLYGGTGIVGASVLGLATLLLIPKKKKTI